eukprot:755756-Amphidinium_carterae.1
MANPTREDKILTTLSPGVPYPGMKIFFGFSHGASWTTLRVGAILGCTASGDVRLSLTRRQTCGLRRL